MVKKPHISRQALGKVLQAENIEHLSYEQLVHLFQAELGITQYIPDGICQVDPRNGERVLYNSNRARRPHDNRPEEIPQVSKPPDGECLICQGRTTGVVDVAELSQGFTFINKNLYPILFPTDTSHKLPALTPGEPFPGPEGMPVQGLHFLQWTSSYHDRDWHNMPQADRIVVLSRLAALEKHLLTTSGDVMPETAGTIDESNSYGFVNIIKNEGSLVGGSLSHGHQQIGFGNIIPRRIFEDWRFQREAGLTFSEHLQQVNPPELLVRDYGAAILLVPYFMSRPYNMMLLLRDVSRRYLHELNPVELAAVADGWHDAIYAIRKVMPQIGREIAYNVITHNGPGAGLYFELLPYTQETGGFEHLGLYVCQANPDQVSNHLRRVISEGQNISR
jgi:galactose-1-phosphate uridylyltransferase